MLRIGNPKEIMLNEQNGHLNSYPNYRSGGAALRKTGKYVQNKKPRLEEDNFSSNFRLFFLVFYLGQRFIVIIKFFPGNIM